MEGIMTRFPPSSRGCNLHIHPACTTRRNSEPRGSPLECSLLRSGVQMCYMYSVSGHVTHRSSVAGDRRSQPTHFSASPELISALGNHRHQLCTCASRHCRACCCKVLPSAPSAVPEAPWQPGCGSFATHTIHAHGRSRTTPSCNSRILYTPHLFHIPAQNSAHCHTQYDVPGRSADSTDW